MCPKTMYPFLFHSMRATFPAHLLLLDFVTRIILHEEHIPHVFSLGNSLRLPVAPPSPMGPQSFNLFFSLSRDNPSPTSIQNKERNILKVCVKYSKPLNTFRQNKHILYSRLQFMSCSLFITKLPVTLHHQTQTVYLNAFSKAASLKLASVRTEAATCRRVQSKGTVRYSGDHASNTTPR
jgi:hypothetical protein